MGTYTEILTAETNRYRLSQAARAYAYGMEDALYEFDPNRARWIGWEAVKFGEWFADNQARFSDVAFKRAWDAYRNRVSLVKEKANACAQRGS